MKYSRSKKADLSLSTNAIVILILAITILGLGLTFVRGLFKQAENKISEVTSSTELANPPTKDNSMTTSPSQLILRQGDVGKVLIAYLNSGSDPAACTLTQPSFSGTSVGDFQVSAEEITVDRDKINIWTAAFEASSADVGTGLYTFKMTGANCEGSKDVIVTVRT